MNGLNGTDAFDPRIAWREGFESIDAATLMDKQLPNSCFLVDGLVPEGVNMISFAPIKVHYGDDGEEAKKGG